MLCPYKGAALLTLEKIKGTVTSYYVNQIYKNEQYNLYWFINSKGYAHVLRYYLMEDFFIMLLKIIY